MQCPNCKSERLGIPVFCGNCGTRMLRPCPICEKENLLDDCYCQYCGTELENVLPGYTLERAKELREAFAGEMGWWDDVGDLYPGAWELVARSGLSQDTNDPREYWLFCCAANGADWKLQDIVINGAKLGEWRKGVHYVPYLCGTRSRLIVIEESQVRNWTYQQIEATGIRGKDVGIRFKGGDLLQFQVNAKGPRMIDSARYNYWSFSSNTAERYLAGSAVETAKRAQSDFLAAVGIYVKQIGKFARE